MTTLRQSTPTAPSQPRPDGEVIYVCKPLPAEARGWNETWVAIRQVEWMNYRMNLERAAGFAAEPDAIVLPFCKERRKARQRQQLPVVG